MALLAWHRVDFIVFKVVVNAFTGRGFTSVMFYLVEYNSGLFYVTFNRPWSIYNVRLIATKAILYQV